MSDELDDLIVLARRGPLTSPEERRLATLLRSSPEAALLHRAGTEFDREGAAQAGDEALAARIAARLTGSAETPPPRRRAPALAWAAAACLLAGAAAASTLGFHAGHDAQAPTGRHGQAAMGHDARTASPPAPAPPPTAKAEPVVTPRVDVPAGPPEPPAPRVRHAARPRVAPKSAADLFAEANRARREGRRDEAVLLYGSLQRLHPRADESHAADLALGLLLLEAQPGAALGHFERSLDEGSPALRAEALWGRSKALFALGRADEARATLERIVREEPGSPYAAAARGKLSRAP